MKKTIIISIIILALVGVGAILFFGLKAPESNIPYAEPAGQVDEATFLESLGNQTEFTSAEIKEQQAILESLSSTSTPAALTAEEIEAQDEIMRSLQSQ